MGSGSSKSDRPDGGIYSPDARAPLSPTVYTDPTSTVNTESGGFHLIEFHGQTLSSAGLLLLGAVAAAWLMVRMWRWMRDRAIKRHVRAQTLAWHTATAWGQYEPVPMPIQMQRLAIPGPPRTHHRHRTTRTSRADRERAQGHQRGLRDRRDHPEPGADPGANSEGHHWGRSAEERER